MLYQHLVRHPLLGGAASFGAFGAQPLSFATTTAATTPAAPAAPGEPGRAPAAPGEPGRAPAGGIIVGQDVHAHTPKKRAQRVAALF